MKFSTFHQVPQIFPVPSPPQKYALHGAAGQGCILSHFFFYRVVFPKLLLLTFVRLSRIMHRKQHKEEMKMRYLLKNAKFFTDVR